MIQWPIWIGIMVVCGVIAYMGDTLGRKLGKKRLSIFGLRPRRTAILVTTLTGCFIFAVSLGSVVTLSKEHRAWVLQGVEELQKRRQELNEKNEELKLLTQELSKTNSDVDKMRKTMHDASKELAEAQGKLGGLVSEKKTLEARNSRARQELAVSGTKLAVAERGLSERAGDIARLDRQIEEYQKTNDTYAKQNQELARENLNLDREAQRLRSEGSQMREDNKRLDAERKDLETRRNELMIRLQQLRNLAPLRTEPLLFGVGTEVARLPAKGGTPATSNLATVDALLASAKEVASRAGAGVDPDGDNVKLLQRVAVSDTGQEIPISQDEVRQAIANDMEVLPGELVLVAYSAINTTASEPLVIDVKVFENPVVFTKDEELGRISIEASETDEAVLTRLIAFLRDDVNAMARTRHMIPMGGSQSIGNVTYADLYSVVRQIRATGTVSAVIARAKADTRAADRLEISFEVAPR